MPKQQLTVMISSTARDLPEHRQQVMDACLRQGMFPIMMEHLPASDADAISASRKLVDEADVYVGVFAHRYGYVPKTNNPQEVSTTEMEYNRAVERKIPRLVFVMDKTHPITIDDVEGGKGRTKLKSFKKRLEKQNIVNFFNSPIDLRAHVISGLSQYRQSGRETFHYVGEIPAPPEAYIAHPYTLLQTHGLVGRQAELNLLTDWVAKSETNIFKARILNIAAIGGLGKSALLWKWFNDIGPQEMKPLAGRLWWSFYESDATFENFVTRALAYVTRRALGDVQKVSVIEREAQLLAALDREPFLIVLDGLERLLVTYARMDAAHLADDEVQRETPMSASGEVADEDIKGEWSDNSGISRVLARGVAAKPFMSERALRKTADPRTGAFLRKLAGVRAARILVSTRLVPADLQTVTGQPMPGCHIRFLAGLTNDDALELWRAFGVTGSRDLLLPLFNIVGNHPLLIQALASEVANYRPAPCDFERWSRDHPDFDPFNPLVLGVARHVLEFALRGLDDKARHVLQIIAGFRMPASYNNLAEILVGEGKVCVDESELDKALTQLEDRGLVGCDRRAGRYDLHPIVRGTVWSGLEDDTRRSVYKTLQGHFAPLATLDNEYFEVNSLEDLTAAIEYYYSLIGTGEFDAAENHFFDRLDYPTLYRLSASRQRIEILEMLFPEGSEQLPRLGRPDMQAVTLGALAQGYLLSGQPGRAAWLCRRANKIDSDMKRDDNLSIGLSDLSNMLRLSGKLHESGVAARRALVITREHSDHFQEAVSLRWLASTVAVQGIEYQAKYALLRALRMDQAREATQPEGLDHFYLAQLALWLGQYTSAMTAANRAWELAEIWSNEGDFIRAARAQGEAALGLNDLATADERLHHALTRARMVNLTQNELPALVALAELRRRQGDLKAAREFLDDVWEPAERGPYPLFHADACNVLAQIERDAGNTKAAVEAATKAYRLAWCDGPPFAYHWGLEAAKKHLKELGAPKPELPPFDATEFEPMPEVEIDPDDEFHVGKNSSN
jgi:tetratricopeptide (TPR) repeat protein